MQTNLGGNPKTGKEEISEFYSDSNRPFGNTDFKEMENGESKKRSRRYEEAMVSSCAFCVGTLLSHCIEYIGNV